ncbi:MAG: hypothetical protein DMF68_04175 [Acidobacteria bacterium]|nr:MAG: hypothetical protein DMF68_04175 [Acidobacteriota bacterium]
MRHGPRGLNLTCANFADVALFSERVKARPVLLLQKIKSLDQRQEPTLRHRTHHETQLPLNRKT